MGDQCVLNQEKVNKKITQLVQYVVHIDCCNCYLIKKQNKTYNHYIRILDNKNSQIASVPFSTAS